MAVTSTISDEELTALALAADPDAPLGDDAEPWVVDDGHAALLRPGTCRRPCGPGVAIAWSWR